MKRKNRPVVPEMRERLKSNRSGKLTSGQWIDIVMQPMTPLLLLLLPGGFILLPRLAVIVARGGWVVLLLTLLLVFGSFVLRAYRYARAPVHFATVTAQEDTGSLFNFWKALSFVDESGQTLRFDKRLCPRPFVLRDEPYIVYYLQGENVLLSIAPEDHPDAEAWRPDRMFDVRLKRRGGV